MLRPGGGEVERCLGARAVSYLVPNPRLALRLSSASSRAAHRQVSSPGRPRRLSNATAGEFDNYVAGPWDVSVELVDASKLAAISIETGTETPVGTPAVHAKVLV